MFPSEDAKQTDFEEEINKMFTAEIGAKIQDLEVKDTKELLSLSDTAKEKVTELGN